MTTKSQRRLWQTGRSLFMLSLTSMLIAFVGSINSAPADPCGARCIYSDAYIQRMVPTGPLARYDILAPQMPKFANCYRIWITDDLDQPNLVDEMESQMWIQKLSDAGMDCLPNSQIAADAPTPGSTNWGNEFALLCYSQCEDEAEE